MVTTSRRYARPPQYRRAVTLNLAKLNEHLFVAGTTVLGLASNCSTFEPLDVRSAGRWSARDALRLDRKVAGDAGRSMPIPIVRSQRGTKSCVQQIINLLLTITVQHCLYTMAPRILAQSAIDRSSWGRAEARGAPRSNVMTSSGVRHHSLLSEFVLAIFGALGLGIPIAIAIIWICSVIGTPVF